MGSAQSTAAQLNEREIKAAIKKLNDILAVDDKSVTPKAMEESMRKELRLIVNALKGFYFPELVDDIRAVTAAIKEQQPEVASHLTYLLQATVKLADLLGPTEKAEQDTEHRSLEELPQPSLKKIYASSGSLSSIVSEEYGFFDVSQHGTYVVLDAEMPIVRRVS